MTSARERLRAALERPGLLVAPFVYDGLQALIAEQAGFEAVYMTGFGTAAARGLPDLGLLTMTEMVDNARRISSAVEIPVICDADTGYGDLLNVIRTVKEYARRLADLPRLYNGQLLPSGEIEERGFKVMIHTATLAVVYRALRDAMRELEESGAIRGTEDPNLFVELLGVLAAPEALERARRYSG